jgi:hypothetical protein
MPTVGWIREGDWEAFLEATESVASPGPPLPPSYRCPFCNTVLSSVASLQSHVSGQHFVARPILLVGGKEPTRGDILRVPIAPQCLLTANATNCEITINGGTRRSIPLGELASEIAKLRQADVFVCLSNFSQIRAAPVITSYDVSIRIAEASTLKRRDCVLRDDDVRSIDEVRH